jgi:dTDP-4-amino-4,6-dideoxygalactose transaminase
MRNSWLALLGGEPVNAEPPRPYNTIGSKEKAAVMEVLESGELSGFIASPGKEFWGGSRVQALEAAFRDRYGVEHALAVNSATSGLHCAMAALDLGPGDEVIVPPYTMSATATAPFMLGALPVFADIEDRTYGLEPAAVESAITPQTRAIAAVNLFGHPARLRELRDLADRHDLYLVEDNAQSPDGLYGGRYTGTIGHVGIFSFNRHKTMQSGEGGVVITDDPKIAQKVALFRNHGEGVVGGLNIDDLVNTCGLNYRMTEMEAAVARAQFERIEELNDARIKLSDRLTAGLSKLDGIVPPQVEADCRHVYYFYVCRLLESEAGLPRDLFVRAVEAEGFPIRAGYVKPIYLEPMYQQRVGIGRNGFPFSTHPREVSYAHGICPTVERLQDHELFLTNMIYPPYTEDDMDGFVAACSKVLECREDLLAWNEHATN